MSNAKLKAALNTTVAAWVKESAASNKSNEKKSELARQYHLDVVDVFADDEDYTPFTFVVMLNKASDKTWEAPKENELSAKKWNTLRARRDEMSAVRDATRKVGADTVKACWPEKEEGKRAVTRETFYSACRTLRASDDVPNDIPALLEKVNASRSNENKAARLDKAREAVKKAGDTVGATGVMSVATMTEAQLREAINSLAMRAFQLGSPLAIALARVTAPPQPAAANDETEKAVSDALQAVARGVNVPN